MSIPRRVAWLLPLIAVCSIPITLSAGEREPAADEKAKPLDTTLLASDAYVAVYAHPRQVFERKDQAPQGLDQAFAAFQEKTGIDPRKIEQLLFQASPIAEGERPDMRLALLLRMTEAIDRQVLLASLQNPMEAKHEGKTYYQATRPNGPSVYFVDEQTFVIGGDPKVRQIMTQEKPKGDFVKLVQAADAKSDLIVVFSMAPVRDMLLAEIENSHGPGPHKALGPGFAKNMQTATLTARLTADEPVVAVMTASDEKSAKELEDVSKRAVLIAKDEYNRNREDMLQGAEHFPPIAAMVELTDKFLGGIEIKRDGESVRASVKAKGGLPELLNLPAMILGFQVQPIPAQPLPAVEEELRR